MPTVYIKTYGCQMNVRDSEQVARDLATRGYDLVEDEAGADVVLLNTCSVRDMAEQKAIGKMQSLEGRKKKPEYVATVTQGYREFLDLMPLTVAMIGDA